MFSNINIDWDLSFEELNGEDVLYSDDELESLTPDKSGSKNRSRPPSLVTGPSALELPGNQKDGNDPRDRSLSTSLALTN